MKARRAEFLISAADSRGFPPETLPEFAFAGRSNVGKSSLMNALVGTPRLARTSGTPGRTRLINWFHVTPARGHEVALVDLPGYGFAKVPREMRDSWQPLVEASLKRNVLRLVFVLIDARRGAETEEHELLEYLTQLEVPACVVLTKSDKLPKSKRKPMAAGVRKDLGLSREPIVSSVTDKLGLDDLWRVIAKHR